MRGPAPPAQCKVDVAVRPSSNMWQLNENLNAGMFGSNHMPHSAVNKPYATGGDAPSRMRHASSRTSSTMTARPKQIPRKQRPHTNKPAAPRTCKRRYTSTHPSTAWQRAIYSVRAVQRCTVASSMRIVCLQCKAGVRDVPHWYQSQPHMPSACVYTHAERTYWLFNNMHSHEIVAAILTS